LSSVSTQLGTRPILLSSRNVDSENGKRKSGPPHVWQAVASTIQLINSGSCASSNGRKFTVLSLSEIGRDTDSRSRPGSASASPHESDRHRRNGPNRLALDAWRLSAMLHRFAADSTVASGRLRLVACGAALHRNVDFMQRGPTILPRRHSGASRKMAMAVVGVVWLGTVALWMLKEFDNDD